MKLDLFDFHLPEELIAQVPLENREASRLMVLDKDNGEVKHDVFKTYYRLFKARGLPCIK